MSSVKQKVLLLLLAGLAFGYSYTPQRQWRVLKEVAWQWKQINEKKLRDEIRRLYQSKLIEKRKNPDGSYTLLLTEKGKMKGLTYRFEEMKINREKWDGKWRLVIFDIPERMKQARDVFRDKLKKLGFAELQKSVFVFPHECEKEIEFVVEFFNLRKYVRFGVLESIDNELHLKQIFNLT